jgi:hypothetical protein
MIRIVMNYYFLNKFNIYLKLDSRLLQNESKRYELFIKGIFR